MKQDRCSVMYLCSVDKELKLGQRLIDISRACNLELHLAFQLKFKLEAAVGSQSPTPAEVTAQPAGDSSNTTEAQHFRTKQGARKSSGNIRAPRRQLASKAARKEGNNKGGVCTPKESAEHDLEPEYSRSM